jgi:hypothetical protein
VEAQIKHTQLENVHFKSNPIYVLLQIQVYMCYGLDIYIITVPLRSKNDMIWMFHEDIRNAHVRISKSTTLRYLLLCVIWTLVAR